MYQALIVLLFQACRPCRGGIGSGEGSERIFFRRLGEPPTFLADGFTIDEEILEARLEEGRRSVRGGNIQGLRSLGFGSIGRRRLVGCKGTVGVDVGDQSQPLNMR